MQAKAALTPFGTPVPELPVADVALAQRHYRDKLGFKIGWLYPVEDLDGNRFHFHSEL